MMRQRLCSAPRILVHLLSFLLKQCGCVTACVLLGQELPTVSGKLKMLHPTDWSLVKMDEAVELFMAEECVSNKRTINTTIRNHNLQLRQWISEV